MRFAVAFGLDARAVCTAEAAALPSTFVPSEISLPNASDFKRSWRVEKYLQVRFRSEYASEDDSVTHSSSRSKKASFS